MALIFDSLTLDLFTILIGLVTICYYFATSTYDYWKKRNIYYKKPLPLLGNFLPALLLRKSPGEFFSDLYNSCNEPYMGLYIFRRPYLLIRDPEIIKQILIKDFQYFSNRSYANIQNDPIGTGNLFTLKNPHWKAMRLKLSPVFSSGKLKLMFPLMNDVGKQLNEHMKNKNETVIDVKSTCGRYSVELIASIAFGIDANSFHKDSLSEFHTAGTKMFKFTLRRAMELTSFFFAPFMTKLFQFYFFTAEGTEFIRKMFWMTANYREQNQIKRNDMIDLMIKLKNTGSVDDDNNSNQDDLKNIHFEDDMIVAQCAAFFAAGFETVASVMTYTLNQLALDNNLQNKVRQEIIKIVADCNGELSYENILDMKLLDQVIKEAMRLYPTLPFLDRECVQDYILPGTNITITKGTGIIIPLLGIQRDSKYFPNPNQYNADRFNEENVQKIKPYTYMPFGVGPHNCIGERYGLMKCKIGLINIIKDFEVVPLPDCDRTVPFKVDPKGLLTTPLKPIKLQMKQIQH